MATCPAGHTSESTDYCDICGSPMDAPAPSKSSTPAPAPKAMGVVCPNCSVMNAPGALFCEACGYDYTTGTMPRPAAPLSILDLDAPLPDTVGGAAPTPQAAPGAAATQPGDSAQPGQQAPGADALTGQPSASGPAGPIQVPGQPGEQTGAAGPSQQTGAPGQQASQPGPQADAPGRPGGAAGQTGSSAAAAAGAALDIDTPAPATPAANAAGPAMSAPPTPTGPPTSGPAFAPGVRPQAAGEETEDGSFDWVLELWIDPEWYALQQSPDAMPSPGLPDVMPLRKKSLLIGRPSRSRGIHPDIDCEPDTGISRRQAELTTDGTRWFIEDLGSANGTYVADASGGLPTDPIPTGRRRELSADQRIYVGAWTRLVLRRATPEEKDAYASV